VILDTRNKKAVQNFEQSASVAKEVLKEAKEVTPFFPAGFHWLPSAMLPPGVKWPKVIEEKSLERLKSQSPQKFKIIFIYRCFDT
jgi:hypothetical protein